jgi:replicative DNA helicase
MADKAGPGMPYADCRIDEYERYLLGAYILGADIGAGITKNIFESGAHKAVFLAIKELKTLGVDADLITLLRNWKRVNNWTRREGRRLSRN